LYDIDIYPLSNLAIVITAARFQLNVFVAGTAHSPSPDVAKRQVRWLSNTETKTERCSVLPSQMGN